MLKIKESCIINALLNKEINILAHGVNCSNGFGAGLAKQIAIRFPRIKKEYHLFNKKIGRRLGDIQLVRLIDDNSFIANLATQEKYGNDGSIYASLEAIERTVCGISDIALKHNLKLGLPLIGSGLGGLKKEDVIKLFESIFNKDKYENLDVTLYIK